MDSDAASRYVRTHGGPVDIARLARLLDATSTPAVLDLVADGQQADGGWCAPWSAGASSVAETCLRLGRLTDLDELRSAPARRAVRWLVGGQLGDGRWQEGTAWSRPDPAADWYLTAHAGLCVALATHPVADAAVRAARALAAEVSEAGTLPSYAVTHWLAAGLCWRTGLLDAADRLLDRLAAVSDGRTAAEWSRCGWALAVSGVPSGHPARAAVVTALSGLQRPDGGWPADDEPRHDVHVTLDALAAALLG
ncbi:MAG TPA: hypothetical protein VGN37_21520 [Actinocatenispora sp.]